jgi:transposase-like protein
MEAPFLGRMEPMSSSKHPSQHRYPPELRERRSAWSGRRSPRAASASETSEERRRITELERENRELRRANEILKSASAFFAAELDGRRPR